VKITKLKICLFLIFLFFPLGVLAQESIVLDFPSSNCLGSENFVNLAWTSIIEGGPDFYVLRKIEGETNFIQITSTGDTSYVDGPVDSDKSYVYKIESESEGITYSSEERTVSAAFCPPVIFPPEASCAVDGPYVSLSWTPVSGDLISYNIYRDGIKIAETLDTVYVDGPNIEGTKSYDYYIEAMWSNGSSSSETTSIVALACSPDLTISSDCAGLAPGGPKVNLSWNNLLGVTEYQIYRKVQGEADFTPLTTTTDTSYTDKLVESIPESYWQEGQVFYYVRAVWLSDNKNSGNEQIDIPRCSPFLSIESNCEEFSFRLSWITVMGATHYNIYRDSNFIGQVSGITNNLYIDYLNSDVCPGEVCSKTYYVDAIITGFPDISSNSITQDIDCATILPPSPAPIINSLKAFCEEGVSKIGISWSASNNVTYYGILRNGSSLLNLLETSYVDEGVESGYEYTYYVTAYGQEGTSTGSENVQTLTAVNCTTPSIPSLNLNVNCLNNNPYVELSWTETTNTLSYEIYKGTSLDNLSLLGAFDEDSPEFTSKNWKDYDVSVSTAYYYKVIAKGPSGTNFSDSETKLITTSLCLPTTPDLDLSMACESGSAVANLSWTTDMQNTHHYEIFRKDYSLTVPIKYIYTIENKSWQDINVSQSSAYEYKVEAVGNLDTQRSTQGYKPITTYNCMAPGDFTLSEPVVYCEGSYPKVDLSWANSVNANNYDLLRNKLTPGGYLIDATTISNVSSVYTGSGYGGALQFDGYYDYVTIPDDESLSPENITLEAWVYPTEFYYYGNIINKRYPGQYILRFYSNTGRVQGYAFVNGAWRACRTSTTVAAPLNEWSHVSFTYDGNVGRVYVNGIQGCSFNYAGSIESGYSTVRIGSYYTSRTSSERFEGLMEDPRIYNRALSPTEIQEHYQRIYNNESGLVGLWRFDEKEGQEVT